MKSKRMFAVALCLVLSLVIFAACGQELSKEDWDRAMSMEDSESFAATAKPDKGASTILKAGDKIKYESQTDDGNPTGKYLQRDVSSYFFL